MKKSSLTHRAITLSCGFLCAWLLFAAGSGLYAGEDRWAWTESAGWAHAEGSVKGTAPEQFAYASGLEEKGEYYDAARQYFLLVQSFPNSPEATRAFTRLAKCLFDCENYYHSFKVVEEYIKKYPKSRHLDELLAFEYRIGRRFLEGARVTLFDEKNTRRKSLRAAVEVFKSILSHEAYIYRGEFADDALYQLGMTYMELNEYRKARDQFAILESRFRQTSELVPLARYRRKLCNIQLGLGTTEQAMEELKRIQRLRQASGQGAENKKELDSELQQSVAEVQAKEAAKMLKSARFYERRNSPKSYNAAVFTYREIVRRYPKVPQAATARERLAALEKSGQPEADIGERKFSLPLPKLKVPKPRLKFWEKPAATKEEPAAAETAAVVDGDYAELDVSPIKSRLYSAGDVVIDVDAEEAKLRNIESGAAPAALSPPVGEGQERAEEAPLPKPQVAAAEPVSLAGNENPAEKTAPAMAQPAAAPTTASSPQPEEEETLLLLPGPEAAAAPEQIAATKSGAKEATQDGWTWSKEFNETE